MRILAALGLSIVSLADLLILDVVASTRPEAMPLTALIFVGATMTIPAILFGGSR